MRHKYIIFIFEMVGFDVKKEKVKKRSQKIKSYIKNPSQLSCRQLVNILIF